VSVRGLLLAAGAGTRYGGPKALARDPDGTSWLLRAVHSLVPCDGVTVVLGASAPEVARLLPPSVDVVVAADWELGMGASLRAGLTALAATDAEAALVTLVDLPDVTAEVVARVLAAGGGADGLARASYDGVPGHPVLIGRDHWSAVAESAVGDRGARDLLATSDVRLVECGDLASGHDVDERT
jgi:CTP:molybdopterin cytidylyltransferase MocA